MPAAKQVAKKLTKKFPWLILPLLCLLVLATLLFFHLSASSQPIIVILGDSNSDRLSITQVEKWSQLYQTAHPHQEVFNLAVGGHAVEDFNTPDVSQQLLQISQDVHIGQPVVLVSLLGTNNAIMSNKIDQPDQFIEDYGAFIDQVSTVIKPQSIIIGSVPPVIVRTTPGNKTPTDPQATQLIPEFNLALQNWVHSHAQTPGPKWYFVSILPAQAYQPAVADMYLIADGVHLDEAAQDIVLVNMTQAINVALQKN